MHKHHYQEVSFWLELVPTVLLFAYILWRTVLVFRHRPRIPKNQIIYQESAASGASQKNVLTMTGGASKCLRLIVTRDLLWVTSRIVPLSAVYDLEHLIALSSITAMQPAKLLWKEGWSLEYTDALGNGHRLFLMPEHPTRLLDALRLGNPALRTHDLV